MAKAIKNPAKTETRVVEVEPETYTLTLTADEAAALQAALGRFESGGPTSAMYAAIRDARGMLRTGFAVADASTDKWVNCLRLERSTF